MDLLRWFRPTKSDLERQLAVLHVNHANANAEIVRLKHERLELQILLDKERQRADDERSRADRITDAVLQQNGIPATTATVLNQQKAEKDALDEEFEERQRVLHEIYGEMSVELTDATEAV